MENGFKLIQHLGFTEYLSKALLALLIRGEATALELSDISGIPKTKVYTVLESINEYLKSPEGTRPRIYRAVDVKSIVDRVIGKREEYVNELKSQKADIISRLEVAASSGEVYKTKENLVWFVPGSESALHEIAKLAQSAHRVLYTISTPRDWVLGHSNMEIITSWIEAIVDRDVESWEIQPRMSPLEYKEVEEALMVLTSKLARARIKEFQTRVVEYFSKDSLNIGEISRENAHFTMVIKDDDTAFLGLRHPYNASSEAGLIISDEKVVRGLQDYFLSNLWSKTISTKNTIREAWFRAILGTKRIQ